MKLHKLMNGAGAATILLATSASMAESIKMNGFASIGAGIQLEEDTVYLGYDEDLTFQPDNILGLQVSAPLNDKLQITGQLVSRGAEEYNVSVEWLYAKYQLAPNTYLKAGRLRIPFFEYSDSIEVGYAYHWGRPPVELYNIPVTSMDGLSLGYNTTWGAVETKLEIVFGRTQGNVTVTADPLSGRPPTEVYAEGLNFIVPSALFEYEWFSVRFSLASFDLSVTNDAIEQNLANLSAPAPEAAEALTMDEKKVLFQGLSLKATPGQAVFGIEINDLDYDTGSLADRKAWYATAGYYIGDVLLHYTYAEVEAKPHYEILDLISQPPVRAGVQANVLDNGLWEQKSHTLGARWDYASRSALKFEISDVESELPAGNKSQLINIIADFVF